MKPAEQFPLLGRHCETIRAALAGFKGPPGVGASCAAMDVMAARELVASFEGAQSPTLTFDQWHTVARALAHEWKRTGDRRMRVLAHWVHTQISQRPLWAAFLKACKEEQLSERNLIRAEHRREKALARLKILQKQI